MSLRSQSVSAYAHVTSRHTTNEEPTLPTTVMRAARVLIADDDESLREMLSEFLKLEGYEVTLVDSAESLLSSVGWAGTSDAPDIRKSYDVIVTDVRMPGASGLDLVQTLRRGGHEGPIVVMTAFPDESVQDRASELEAFLIAKPFSLETMCFALRALSLPSWAPIPPEPARLRSRRDSEPHTVSLKNRFEPW